MKTRVYLDTSVISALFDERTPERMTQTKQAWSVLKDCDTYISQTVVSELSNASTELKKKFFDTIADFSVLEITDAARFLANEYVGKGIFPTKYIDDALHVAVAATNNIGILLSWNFTHLVKIKTRRMIALVNLENNYPVVEIIAPPEL